MIKRLLKKHRYPPEGMDDAVQTVMTQCELWTDNNDMELSQKSSKAYTYSLEPELSKVAEEPVPYGKKQELFSLLVEKLNHGGGHMTIEEILAGESKNVEFKTRVLNI